MIDLSWVILSLLAFVLFEFALLMFMDLYAKVREFLDTLWWNRRLH